MLTNLIEKPLNLLEGKSFAETNVAIVKSFPGIVKATLKDISLHFGNKNGHIDYYSPEAKNQIEKKQEIINEHLDYFRILQATFLAVHRVKEKIAQKQNEQKMTKILAALTNIRDIKKLRSHPMVVGAFATLKELDALKIETSGLDKEIEGLKKEIRSINEQLATAGQAKLKREKLEKQLNGLQEKIAKIQANKNSNLEKIKLTEAETSKIKQIQELEIPKSELKKELAKQKRLAEQIPEGMLDLKRALYILAQKNQIDREIKKKQDQLSKSGDDKQKQESLLKEIKHLESKQISFSNLPEENKQIIDLLSDLQGLMARTSKDYRDLAVSGGSYNAFLHKTTAFYWESLYLYKETLEALEAKLKNATQLTDKGDFIKKCITQAVEEAPTTAEINKARKKVKKADENLQERATIYDGRTDAEKAQGIPPSGFYRPNADKYLTKMFELEGDFFYLPYNANLYTLDHPAHQDLAGALGNCYGETMMFLLRLNRESSGDNTQKSGGPSLDNTLNPGGPTFNNICPESELINFQLDQSRGFASKTNLGKKNTTEKLKWEDIKDLITAEVKSEKKGDLCVIKLSGATVEGHASSVGHSIGLIKLKQPSTYKYVVYDYNFGAVGLTDDKQLESYFNAALDYYLPFYEFKLEKHADVVNGCFNFINGIKPLTKTDFSKTCQSNETFWDKSRLTILAKYGFQDKMNLVIEKAEKLSTADQNEIYETVIKRFSDDLEISKQLAVKNPELLKYIKNEANLLKILPAITLEIIDIAKAFQDNEQIVKAACIVSLKCLPFANTSVLRQLLSADLAASVQFEPIEKQLQDKPWSNDTLVNSVLRLKELKELKAPLRRAIYRSLLIYDGSEPLSKIIEQEIKNIKGRSATEPLLEKIAQKEVKGVGVMDSEKPSIKEEIRDFPVQEEVFEKPEIIRSPVQPSLLFEDDGIQQSDADSPEAEPIIQGPIPHREPAPQEPSASETEELSALKKECESLLLEISNFRIRKDDLTIDKEMNSFLEQNRNRLNGNKEELKSLREVLKVTFRSLGQDKATPFLIKKIEKFRSAWVNWGDTEKANRIEEALSNVPITERANIQEGKSTSSLAVLDSLRAHRHWWRSKEVDTKSFSEFKKEMKKVSAEANAPNDNSSKKPG